MASGPSGEDLFRLFVESVQEYAIFAMDADGRVVHWNSGAARVLGYCEDEVLGKCLTMIFTPEDVAAGVPGEELAAAARNGQSDDERWHVRKGGSRFWAQGIVVPLRDADGALCGFGKILRDRTDTKALQENLRSQARHLEQVDDQKNIFLATLSHELRNPLAPLANCVRLLRKGEQAVSPIADMMDRQIMRLQRLVDDLLDVTRISRGRLDLHNDRVDLGRIVQQTADGIRVVADARRQEIKVTVPSHPVVVEGDAGRLEQVLTNLLDNAIKYTEPGGLIAMDLQVDHASAAIRVRDNGLGIPEQKMPHIFELFAQAHPALQQSEAGLGLGLALVKELVRLHGGTVEAKSAGAGKGSEFTVRLPLTNAGLNGPH